MLGRMVEIKDMLGNHQIIRADGRKVDELRPVRITRHFTDAPEGSVLIECGNTRVMCTATFTPGVPRWRKDSGLGWVTAEYSMLPRATAERTDRESVRGKIGGRTHEISRLIGRCLRGVIDMKALGENQIQLALRCASGRWRHSHGFRNRCVRGFGRRSQLGGEAPPYQVRQPRA